MLHTRPSWEPYEDDVLREEWGKGRFFAKDRARVRLPHRSLVAIQVRASALFRNAPPPAAPVAEKPTVAVKPEPVKPEPVAHSDVTRVIDKPCDPGDRDYIRKRLHYVALALSKELGRPPAAIYAAIAKVAAAGFQPDGGSRVATTEEVIAGLTLPRGGYVRS